MRGRIVMIVETFRVFSVFTENLLSSLQKHFSQEDLDVIKRACIFADEHYMNTMHPIGKPYIQYASEIVLKLADLGADQKTIAVALLNPPPSTPDKVLNDIKKKFKDDEGLVALFEELCRLNHLEWNYWPSLDQNEFKQHREIIQKMYLLAIEDTKSEQIDLSVSSAIHFQKKDKQVENLIRMFLTTNDVRALIIKLVDWLHFIQLLKDLIQCQQTNIPYEILAKISLTIYAPLADRLGLWRLKSELEDMSFRLIQPEKYRQIREQLVVKKADRKKYIHDIIAVIREYLQKAQITAIVTGRAKHIYSIYQKMEAKQLTFEKINDLLGIRIIVDTSEECYAVQSILLDHWEPLTEFYDGKVGRDWIAKPKENLYQSLHTTIKIEDKIVEIQIRTRKMHEIAEYGVASAHWKYKGKKAYLKGKTPIEKREKEKVWNEQLNDLRKSLATEQSSSNKTQNVSLKKFIFVITPEGHVLDLPAGATPLDFAYRIHTHLGHGYMGAKVDGRLVHTEDELKNGEIVELLPAKTRRGPSPVWLSVSKNKEGKRYYVYARTRQARSKIRSWLRANQTKDSKDRSKTNKEHTKPSTTSQEGRTRHI